MEFSTDEDTRDQQKMEIAHEIEEALRLLYLICDMDEVEVGEIMDEVHKAARINAAE